MIKRILHSVWCLRQEKLYKKKLNKILVISGQAKLDNSIIKDYERLWSGIQKNPSKKYPALYANINGIISPLYVPENTYFNTIELILNNKAFALAYSDKNFYEKYISSEHIFPLTLIRGINGWIYDKEFHPLNDKYDLIDKLTPNTKYVLKPSIETSGGSNLVFVEFHRDVLSIGSREYTIKEFLHILKIQYRMSFVIQECIEQHSWFAGFNESSVNTIRIFTYRSVRDNIVHPLHSVLRFGQDGSIVDNQAAGGLSCGISSQGRLNSFAVDKFGNKYSVIDYLNKNSGIEVPELNEMKNIAVRIASKYYYHRLLGFDFCLGSNNKVRLFEINCKNIETNFLQMNNGPLFGDFTREIIDFCSKNRRSVVFDFYI